MSFITQLTNEIVREIDEKLAAQIDAMTRGIEHGPDYWRSVGLIQGLRAMRLYVNDLANRAEREDDD